VVKKLTDVRVRTAKPKAARYEVSDGGSPLRLVVQPSGARSYAVRFRVNGETRKLTLPRGISLAAARKLSADAMLQASQGIDPCKLKNEAKAEAASAAKDTLRSVCADYFQSAGARELRTAYERERVITQLVYPSRLAKLPIADITRRQITELLNTVEAANGRRSADIMLGILRRIFRWHRARDDKFDSFPFIPEMSRYRYSEHARDRTLNDDELRHVWAAAGQAGVYGAMLKFLLLTSARLREAACMKWEEIGDDGVWELPKARNKLKTQPLARPLPEAVFTEVLNKLPRIGPFVFTLDGEHAFSAFSRHKRLLDLALGDKVKPFVVHDLRRTSRSLMSRAGVPIDHAERVLGHVIGGVRGVYDRHAFHQEKRHALEALAAQIERVINPADNVVVALRG
jgi:integrase